MTSRNIARVSCREGRSGRFVFLQACPFGNIFQSQEDWKVSTPSLRPLAKREGKPLPSGKPAMGGSAFGPEGYPGAFDFLGLPS